VIEFFGVCQITPYLGETMSKHTENVATLCQTGKVTVQKRPFFLLVVLSLAISLAVSAGCGNNAGTSDGGNAASPSRGGGSAAAIDQDLNDVLKKGLNRGVLSDLPLDITDISINWDKAENEASGRFSVKTKAVEGLYNSIGNSDALRKLGITDLYEGELNVARGKINSLPEPHRTNLRNAAPQDQLSRLRFYDVVVPSGGEVTITGRAELAKYGSDWQADNIQVNSFSIGDNFTPESKLQESHKLDDPKTKEAVNAIIQERRDFAAKVDSTVADVEREKQEAAAEAERQRLAGLQKQKEDFAKFCKPGMKYEGSFQYKNASGAVSVTFDEWATNDQNSVKGSIMLFDKPDVKIQFTATVNVREVTPFPVTGEYTVPWRRLRDVYELTSGALGSMNDLFLFYTRISIQFTDGKMDFGLASGSNRIPFNLSALP